MGATDAWSRHVPFGHWLAAHAAPRMVVELGTRTGVSFTAFCQAVARGPAEARCYAVGAPSDDGPGGEPGFDAFRAFHDARFSGFSALLRCGFDDALRRFADGSIDLLHIDGPRTRAAAPHDFERWAPKLSDRAVVLFHGTNARAGDAGVWRFWAELRRSRPGFEFLHGDGLGVVAAGERAPAAARLCSLGDPAEVAAARQRFAALGERCLAEAREAMLAEAAARQAAAAAAERLRADERDRAREQAERRCRLQAGMRRRAAERTTGARQAAAAALERAERAETAEALARAEAAEAVAALAARMDAERAALVAEAAALRRALGQAEAERDSILRSTAWRATAPLRGFGGRVPGGIRRALRGSAAFGWRSLAAALRGRRAADEAAADAPGAAKPDTPTAGAADGQRR
jgi:hypothetical protein